MIALLFNDIFALPSNDTPAIFLAVSNAVAVPALPEIFVTPVMYPAPFVIALLLSSVIAVINYLLHDKITSLFEISKYSSGTIGVLGMIPMMKNKMPVSPLIIHKSPKSMITESFRAIRTNLQFISNSQVSKMIAISSTVSGEGKTFLAINLAGIIAFTGKKVVIIDLDMRKPKIHRGFNIKNTLGMSDILAGKNTFEECVNFIIADSERAFDLLDGREMESGRANPTAALALKARILLYAASDLHDYSTASANSSLLSGYSNPELIAYTSGDQQQRWIEARDAVKEALDYSSTGYKLDLTSPVSLEEGQQNYTDIFLARNGGEANW